MNFYLLLKFYGPTSNLLAHSGPQAPEFDMPP